MLIVIDIGNTSIKIGMYSNDILIDKATFVCDRTIGQEALERTFSNIFKNKNISNCLIASVVDQLTPIVKDAILNVCNITPLIVSSDLNLNINIKAEHPEKIGIDRIVNAVAAVKQYIYPLIVIDLGTATTFDIVNADGNFIGGIILPGISTQIKSLASNTSKLPEINICEMDKVKNTINTDSVKAILTGVVKGHIYSIEGLIQDCIKELKAKPTIIATGGNAKFISQYMSNPIFDYVNPSLTLEGIKHIYDLNKK